MNWKCVAAFVLFLTVSMSHAASAALTNLVSNNSFEDPGGGNLVPNLPGIPATYITGWEVYVGDIDYIPPSTWTASDGVMSLDLHGFNPGGIRQTISTVPGETYNVAFDMAANPSGGTLKTLRVSAAGSNAEFTFDRTGKTTTNMGWETKTWSFVASSTSTVLSFESVGSYPLNAGPALDNVFVVTGPTTILGVPANDFDGVATGVSLGAGESVIVCASGTWSIGGPYGTGGGDGATTFPTEPCALAVSAPMRALIGSLNGGLSWFLVGSGPTTVVGPGSLLLAANDCPGPGGLFYGDNSGALTVTITPPLHRPLPVRLPTFRRGNSQASPSCMISPFLTTCVRGPQAPRLTQQTIQAPSHRALSTASPIS